MKEKWILIKYCGMGGWIKELGRDGLVRAVSLGQNGWVAETMNAVAVEAFLKSKDLESTHMLSDDKGESQRPPESARKGRRCQLTNGITEVQFFNSEWRFDTTTGRYVVYDATP